MLIIVRLELINVFRFVNLKIKVKLNKILNFLKKFKIIKK